MYFYAEQRHFPAKADALLSRVLMYPVKRNTLRLMPCYSLGNE